MKYTQFIESVKKLPKPFKKGSLSVVYLDLFKTEIELNYLPTGGGMRSLFFTDLKQ